MTAVGCLLHCVDRPGNDDDEGKGHEKDNLHMQASYDTRLHPSIHPFIHTHTQRHVRLT